MSTRYIATRTEKVGENSTLSAVAVFKRFKLYNLDEKSEEVKEYIRTGLLVAMPACGTDEQDQTLIDQLGAAGIRG